MFRFVLLINILILMYSIFLAFRLIVYSINNKNKYQNYLPILLLTPCLYDKRHRYVLYKLYACFLCVIALFFILNMVG